MSADRITRIPYVRVLLTALAWLIVLATVSGASSALGEGSPNHATGLITAATNITALLFLVALRRPRLRKIAGVRRAGETEIIGSWRMYQKEILRIAILPTLGTLAMLWASDPSLRLIGGVGHALGVLILAGTSVVFYVLTARTIRSMKGEARSGAPHHPVLGVVLGSLLTVALSLLALGSMALAGSLTWQVVIACAIAGVATFAAALTTLWAVSTAKN
ncbi:hypothetical protein [Actinomadura mexicana]|uniref:Uncharacterized protein n=1 Tax=Actinomadura mexicana TaxID=134959 RepID=A0A238WXE6_9ACTN|nr:hypothetical protein [Actinomadura mexicana]SNR51176.1 hypothetical protein SAMN06265355_103429 [Actinomadura mexicana]